VVNEAEPQTQPEGDVSGEESDQETYPKSVVDKLREENAANRIAAKDAQRYKGALMVATREAATGGILWDPSDLPISEDGWREDGTIDHEKINDAAIELTTAKPHLARPRGSAGQGARQPAEPPFSLAGMLRKAAR
jgi:hypothetical protein